MVFVRKMTEKGDADEWDEHAANEEFEDEFDAFDGDLNGD
jgi:hypothetical protein